MGTRALLVIEADNEAGHNTFYAQYGSPAYKIPALTRWITAAAATGQSLTADAYAEFASNDEADHFHERLEEKNNMATACRAGENSDLEYIYWIGTMEAGAASVGHFAMFHKSIGDHSPGAFKVTEGTTWTAKDQDEMHALSMKYLSAMKAAITPRSFKSEATLEAINEALEWHANAKA